MKEKRMIKLSCERARNVCIVATMAKLGHFPTKSSEKEAWFLSPFRSETQASFKVSKKLNRWYDHGAGIGGNVIDLVCLITKSSVREALKLIGQDQTSFSFQQQPILMTEEENTHKIIIIKIKELTHVALKEYLKSRNIELKTALGYCKEVHYGFKGKSYFAIGLHNESGGWELRNKYYKNSSSPKDITHIRNGHTKLIITEGMFDLLSIIEVSPRLEAEHDFLVMNSIAFISKTSEIMNCYLQIDLYLDNDPNGKRTAKKLMEHSKNCEDKSKLYTGFNDMNEWLINNTKNALGQETQDVFLLPQKQTCFAPGGRKEKKK
ncbi:toprim domain-containing protein [Maribacter polysiphoniae]|uniref:CHC2-type zinc finger protein n=1 Tax=Maribacter polysiphoniae TaxID=429344 RepID=A0A316E7D5_9FLAO|nr:toprim domain-containing protein [Maribacter polysiphoniae]MBD1259825.1 toprim domain-containing protein [Maribacter polysiphoniae]PWK25279.1 CHC2-type zinc finger protein [Maribacter polysiphoniae]